MTDTVNVEICPACNGARIQINLDGLKVLCPACGGTGKIGRNMYDWWKPVYTTISVTAHGNYHVYGGTP